MSASARWKSPNGKKEAWVVDYRDQDGKRHQVACAYKKKRQPITTRWRSACGRATHTPESRSLTVAEAGELWLRDADATELNAHRRRLPVHLKSYIVPSSDLQCERWRNCNVPRAAKFKTSWRSRAAP